MPESFAAFIELYSDLPREGPGSVDSLLSVLEMAATPVDARIYDAACGSGADSATFARALPDAKIIGKDTQAPFIEAAKARNLRAEFEVGDMLKPEGVFDLIWCAGAVYFVGLEKALQTWRKHLKPGGKIAFSEIAWLSKTPDARAVAHWAKAYPQMARHHALIGRIEACGYRVIAADPLGRAGWQVFYDGLKQRITALQERGPVMDAVLAEELAEIDIFETCFPDYDYVMFLVEPV